MKSDLDDLIECESCGALFPPPATVCKECGGLLAVPPLLPRERRPRCTSGPRVVARADAAGEVRERADHRRRVAKIEARKSLAIVLVVILAIVMGPRMLRALTTASRARSLPDLDVPVLEWESAIESGDLDGAGAMCSAVFRPRWPRIEQILEREGWSGGVELGDPVVRELSPFSRDVRFALPRGQMKTTWLADDDGWRVDRVVMSHVRAR